MAVNVSPFGPKPQFELADGTPAVGNKLFFYVAGSVNTKRDTFTDSTGSVANTNPIILNSLGTPSTQIWFTAGLAYKVVYAPSTDNDPPTSPIWTIDNLTGVNDVTATQDQWVANAGVPVFVSATSFTLIGDQTSTFHPGRRLKSTNSGGTIYSTVVSSVFGALTTVTVVNDSGVLDVGMSAVNYGLISAVNPSIDADMVNRKGTAVAAAATTNIWAVAGDFVHITGAGGPITSFGTAPYAGNVRTVIVDSTPTITHNSTTLQLPGGQSIVAQAGDRFIVRADTTTNMVVIAYERAIGTGPSVPRGHIAGMTMSTAGGSATMTVAAGQAADSTNSVLMNLTASIAKTTGAWAVGTGNGGKLSAAAIANNTWYRFYEIMRPDTGVVEIGFDVSATTPTMPANYVYFRGIGSGKTDGSAQWVVIIQNGDDFGYSTPPAVDKDGTGTTANRTLTTVAVPTGIKVKWNGNLQELGGAGGAQTILLTDPACADVAPSASATPLANLQWSGAASSNITTQENCWTNTSAQIGVRVTQATDNIRIQTIGWTDRRGRDD